MSKLVYQGSNLQNFINSIAKQWLKLVNPTLISLDHTNRFKLLRNQACGKPLAQPPQKDLSISTESH
uniref:Transposase n=1 Tax=Caenorhabditis tropicalis TaxID=1561998 RepID=A0A1I7TD30_9PELO